MTQQSIDRIVQEFFPKSRKGDWEKAATLEMQKKNPLESLAWRGKDNILFLPYYNEVDAAHLESSANFQNHHSAQESHSRTWINLPSVFSPDAHTANAHADINRLLADIQLQHCFAAFRIASDPDFLQTISDYLQKTAVAAEASGALFWESIPKKGDWNVMLHEYRNFHSLGIIISPSSPAKEIADALTTGVTIIDELCRSYPLASVFHALCFSLPADSVFFESIAKFRALRQLWYQLACAYGLNDYNSDALHIHAFSRAVPDGAYAPHENMLKGTFSAMASILGGCSAVTVEAPDQPSLGRWARNVANILGEESFLGAAPDPTAGAYSIDCITESIAKRAWSLFQQNVRTL